MILFDIIKHQSIIDKREPRSDTLQFLEKKRYSVSKKKFIKYGDMHIDHFLSTVNNDENNDDNFSNTDFTKYTILKLVYNNSKNKKKFL